MRRASQELEQLLQESDWRREGPALQRFESGVRELNQINALARAQHMRNEGDRVERRGSWNRTLVDNVVRRASMPDLGESEDVEEGVLGYYAGAGVARARFGRPPLPQLGESEEGEAAQKHSADIEVSQPVRVVGSLTPAVVTRRTSGPRRQSGSYARGIGLCASIGSHSEGSSEAGSRRSSRGMVAAPDEDTHFFQVQVRPQRRMSTPSLRSSFGSIGDSSATKVTGRVDYRALLQEQDDDLKARRVSSDKYEEMLKDVDEYQKKMLEHLDSQLVFMGITEEDIQKTAHEFAHNRMDDEFEI